MTGQSILSSKNRLPIKRYDLEVLVIMKILDSVKKVPGGLMVVPLLLGAVINTFFPEIMALGGLHSAFFSKAAATPAIAFFLVCVGAQIDFRNAPEAIKRGGVLLLTKFLAGALFGYAVAKLCGPAGFLGISSLAIISSVTNSNGGLFMALAGEFRRFHRHRFPGCHEYKRWTVPDINCIRCYRHGRYPVYELDGSNFSYSIRMYPGKP